MLDTHDMRVKWMSNFTKNNHAHFAGAIPQFQYDLLKDLSK